MQTKITDDLWLDLDKLVRVAKDGEEVKYTMDYIDKMITFYCPTPESGEALLKILEERNHQRMQTVDEMIDDLVNNNGEEV